MVLRARGPRSPFLACRRGGRARGMRACRRSSASSRTPSRTRCSRRHLGRPRGRTGPRRTLGTRRRRSRSERTGCPACPREECPTSRLRERPNLPLDDVLQLVRLYAERDSPKYEKAALRWLARYLTEGSPRLPALHGDHDELGEAGDVASSTSSARSAGSGSSVRWTPAPCAPSFKFRRLTGARADAPVDEREQERRDDD